MPECPKMIRINILNFIIVRYLVSILLLFGTGHSIAQGASDFVSRQQLIVNYKTSKNLSFAGTYYLNLQDNSSRFDQSVLGFEVEYKITKWLEAGVEYRYGMNYKQDEHEFRYALEGAYSPTKKPFKFKLRTMLEQGTDYFDRDYLAVHPIANTLRNRLIGSYKLNKKTDVYVLFEAYNPLKKSSFLLSQANYALGADYQLKRRHGFNVELQYRDFFLKKRNNDKIRLDIAYKLSLGYLKPKKKKKQGKMVEEKLNK